MLALRSLGLCVAVVLVAACGGTKNTGGSPTGTGASTGTGGSSTGTASTGMGGSSTGTAGTSSSTGTGTGGGMGKSCPVFLATSPWNTDISDTTKYPKDPLSDTYIKSIGATTNLHPDFGADPTSGIPYQYVNNSVAKSPVTFDPQAAGESDMGPYPIPANPIIEVGNDRHLLMVQTDECVLYELDVATKAGSTWNAYSGAIWDLKTNSTRTACWTSADAAGLPIYPGLARYEEVAKGAINHALRFTAQTTQNAFIPPAGHYAGKVDPSLPPMGLRMRLKSNYDISGAPPQSKIILTALKKYGLILADNGGSWYISGAPDPGWVDDPDLSYLTNVPGSALEAIKTGPLTGPSGCP